MGNKGRVGDKSKGFKSLLEKINKGRKTPVLLFFLIIILYISAYIIITKTSVSRGMFTIFGVPTPVTAITGIFSGLANICLILLVFFFGKVGFITSLAILLVQFPIFLFNLSKSHNMGSLSGIFIDLLSILAMTIIYINKSRMEKYQENLREQAVKDMLTGLPSRFACITSDKNTFSVRRMPFTPISLLRR